MSKSLNSVSLTGYLGADPKTHTFDDGTMVANLRLAVSRQKKEGGEWVDDTLWIDVKAFGKQAEAIEQYLAKGSFVAVSGQLAQPREWEGDDGKRFTMVVDHATVTFGPRANGDGAATQTTAPKDAPLADDDIPF
jgi:single-strand DNA-binding protein